VTVVIPLVIPAKCLNGTLAHHDGAVAEPILAQQFVPNRSAVRQNVNDALNLILRVDLVIRTSDKSVIRMRFEEADLGFKTMGQGYVIGIHNRDVDSS